MAISEHEFLGKDQPGSPILVVSCPGAEDAWAKLGKGMAFSLLRDLPVAVAVVYWREAHIGEFWQKWREKVMELSPGRRFIVVLTQTDGSIGNVQREEVSYLRGCDGRVVMDLQRPDFTEANGVQRIAMSFRQLQAWRRLEFSEAVLGCAVPEEIRDELAPRLPSFAELRNRFWSLLAEAEEGEVEAGEGGYAVAWHPGGELLAVGNRGWLRVLRTASGAVEWERNVMVVGFGLAWRPDGEQLAVASLGAVLLLEGSAGTLPDMTVMECTSHAIAWHPTGELLAVGNSFLGMVQVVSIPSMSVVCTVDVRFKVDFYGNLRSATLLLVDWHPGGAYLAAAVEERLFVYRSSSTGILEASGVSAELHTCRGDAIAWRPGLEPTLAIVDSDGVVQLMHCDTGHVEQVQICAGLCSCVAWHPGRKVLAVGRRVDNGPQNISVGSAASASVLEVPSVETVRCISWHPGGDLLAWICVPPHKVRLLKRTSLLTT